MQGLTNIVLTTAFGLSLTLTACGNHSEECKPATAPTPKSACFVETPVASDGDTQNAATLATTSSDEVSPLQGPAAPNGSAVDLVRDALEADRANNLELCIAKEKEALKIDDMPRSRLHLASCEARSHRLIDSLRDSEHALEQGIIRKDTPVMKVARMRVKETLVRIPHVTFRKAGATPPVKLTFDGKDVPYETAEKKFSVDPGPHVVEVTNADGVSKCDLLVSERTLTAIAIR